MSATLKRTERMTVTVQATVQVGTSRPQVLGWEAKFDPSTLPDQIAATVTDICRRLHEETQEAVR